MGKSQSLTIASVQISQSQMVFAGSVRLNKGDRVQVVGTYTGTSEMLGKYGEIKKHRGFGRFMIALDGGEKGTFEGTCLRKVSN